MRERPILFSAPMVRAILEGRKTQTRRVVKQMACPDPDRIHLVNMTSYAMVQFTHERSRPAGTESARCPYGQPGDRLWVRETWACADVPKKRRLEAVQYRATCEYELGPYLRWRPSIFMPRWASRITLEVTGVRVERLWDICQEDAWAEGCTEFPDRPSGKDPSYWVLDPGGGAPLADTPRDEFAGLWCRINGLESWGANPWVWVIEFRRVEAAERREGVANG